MDIFVRSDEDGKALCARHLYWNRYTLFNINFLSIIVLNLTSEEVHTESSLTVQVQIEHFYHTSQLGGSVLIVRISGNAYPRGWSGDVGVPSGSSG